MKRKHVAFTAILVILLLTGAFQILMLLYIRSNGRDRHGLYSDVTEVLFQLDHQIATSTFKILDFKERREHFLYGDEGSDRAGLTESARRLVSYGSLVGKAPEFPLDGNLADDRLALGERATRLFAEYLAHVADLAESSSDLASSITAVEYGAALARFSAVIAPLRLTLQEYSDVVHQIKSTCFANLQSAHQKQIASQQALLYVSVFTLILFCALFVAFVVYENANQRRILNQNDLLETTVSRRTQELEKANSRLQYEVNKHRVTEEIQRQQEREYRNLFDAMKSAVANHEIIRDQAGVVTDYRILAVNPAFERTTGLRAGALVGNTAKTILSGLGPKWREVFDAIARHGQPVHFEEFSAEFDKHFEAVAYSPAENKLAVVFNDITDRKKAETALQESAGIVDNIPVGLQIYRDDVLVSANRASEEILGLPVEETIGKPVSDVLPTELQNLIPAAVKEVKKTGLPVALTSGKGGAADRDGRWYRIKAFPLSPETVGIAIEDVSDQARAEDQLRHAQKMEDIGRLAGGVAHDFNNILTAILGHADMLLDDQEPEDASTESLREIKRSAERAASLTQQLLAYSRKQLIKPELVDLNKRIQDISGMLSRLIGEHISLELHLDSGLGYIFVDAGQIDQILMNLTVNARDAMPDGGTLSITSRNTEIGRDFSGKHPEVESGEYVHLVIHDTGAGMSEEVRRKIFEPYFTTKGIGEGTGLGLSTTYGIVKRNGGFIYAASGIGQGSTFDVYFPRAREDQASMPVTQPAPALEHAGESILVVEDEEPLRRMLKAFLEREGYSVTVAENGHDALATVAAMEPEDPDLVITDVIMPIMNGKDLMDVLHTFKPNIKELFISGYTDDFIASHGVLDVGVSFLQKPFTRMDLLREVRSILDNR